ncbi:hypothetical protein PHYPSEUDO_007086 [Phytophthora pseudosyringae]|uniref:Uncharacterized protein n=1 Tax=Phytophthora pseudosyringae TaxID=221518 RepID=A0A8T1VK19_9STRA|nr:hypothetical protein PHYPSEUDO_007086 [Phytophthora pseudosyringae]
MNGQFCHRVATQQNLALDGASRLAAGDHIQERGLAVKLHGSAEVADLLIKSMDSCLRCRSASSDSTRNTTRKMNTQPKLFHTSSYLMLNTSSM